MVKLFTSSATCWNTEKSTPWNSKSLESLWFPLSSLFPEGFSSPFRCPQRLPPVSRLPGRGMDSSYLHIPSSGLGCCCHLHGQSWGVPTRLPEGQVTLCAHLIEINKGGAVFPRGHSRSQLSIVSLMNSLQNEGSCTLIIRNTGRP